MSELKPIILDETGQEIKEAIEQNTAAIIAAQNADYDEDKTLLEVRDARTIEGASYVSLGLGLRTEFAKTAKRSELQKEATERKSEVAVERARIDNLAKLGEGSTTGDAELLDMRVGADGITYENAGAAVRAQVSQLSSEIDEVDSKMVSPHDTYFFATSNNLFNKYDKNVLIGKFLDATGNLQVHTAYATTGFIPVHAGHKYSASDKGFTVSFYDKNKNWVSSLASTLHTGAVEIPTGIYFARFVFYLENLHSYQVVEGEECGDYEPYSAYIPSEYLEIDNPNSTLLKKSLKDYLYRGNAYIGTDGTITDWSGINIYKIPVTENDFIQLANVLGESICSSLSEGYLLIYEDESGNFVSAWNDSEHGNARQTEILAFVPANVVNAYINVDTATIENTRFRLNDTYVSDIREDNLTPYVRFNMVDLCLRSNVYVKTTGLFANDLGEGYSTYWFTVKSGDVLHIESINSEGLSLIGGVINKTDFTKTYFYKSTTLFTCPCDGYVFLMSKNDVSPIAWLETSNNSIVSKLLSGKKWCSLGDSITKREMWQGYVVDKLGLSHINCGIGSTCLSGSTSNAFWQDVRLQTIKDNNPDIVTILGGANDLVLNPVIGTDAEFSKALSEKDTNTFIGAYSYIIENLLTWKPTLEIMILGTTWAHHDGADYSDTVTYTDYSNACKLVAEYYGLPFVDLHSNCGFNAFTMAKPDYNIYSTDDIHPNEKGGKKIASLVIAKMKEVYS